MLIIVFYCIHGDSGRSCWQVGYHVAKQTAFYPLDYPIFSILFGIEDMMLRNRLI